MYRVPRDFHVQAPLGRGCENTRCRFFRPMKIAGLHGKIDRHRRMHQEPYSRVTNPERFASLHDSTAELLRRLQDEFDLERAEGYALDPELAGGLKIARPSVTLVPRNAGAAPIAVVFSTFPGVRVRLGYWYMSAFPACGCDACEETVEGETERLLSLIDSLTAGRFREAIQIPAEGQAWRLTEFWSAGGRSGQKEQLDRASGEQIVSAKGRSSFDWKPWPGRK